MWHVYAFISFISVPLRSHSSFPPGVFGKFSLPYFWFWKLAIKSSLNKLKYAHSSPTFVSSEK